jgi:hypothetical protein
MAYQYIKLPSEMDLYGIKYACISDKKNKIIVDPKCKCGSVTRINLGKESQLEFEARRREQKPEREKIEEAAWSEERARKKATAKAFFFPYENLAETEQKKIEEAKEKNIKELAERKRKEIEKQREHDETRHIIY